MNTYKNVFDIAGQRLGQREVTVRPPYLHEHPETGVVDNLERSTLSVGLSVRVLLSFLSTRNMLVHLPFLWLAIAHMSSVSTASCSFTCTQSCFAFWITFRRPTAAIFFSCEELVDLAIVWAALHSSFHHRVPLGLGAHFGSSVFWHVSSMVSSTCLISQYKQDTSGGTWPDPIPLSRGTVIVGSSLLECSGSSPTVTRPPINRMLACISVGS